MDALLQAEEEAESCSHELDDKNSFEKMKIHGLSKWDFTD